jgi:hypothetical protein
MEGSVAAVPAALPMSVRKNVVTEALYSLLGVGRIH